MMMREEKPKTVNTKKTENALMMMIFMKRGERERRRI